MIVLDTNVLSEVVRLSASPKVVRWLMEQGPVSVFTTAVTQAEMLYGLEALPAGKRRSVLQVALERIFGEFHGRILPFDHEAAKAYATIASERNAIGRPISQFDAMIAAIARSRRAAVATRNVAHFEGCGIRIVNPWAA